MDLGSLLKLKQAWKTFSANHPKVPAFVEDVKKSPLVSRKYNAESPRLRFADQKLYVEKNGKRFNLNGHRIK